METFNHCIFIASNYTSGTRKGLDYLFNESNVGVIRELIKKYASWEGVSIYTIQTDSPDISSIAEKDKFFENVHILDGVNPNKVIEFEKTIKNQIKAFDVALLFMTRKPFSYYELNTLLVLCYLEYFSKHGVPPFPDKVFLENNTFSIQNFTLSKFLRGKQNATVNDRFLAKREDIVLSKYFNTEGGTELMNSLLNIYFEISRQGSHQFEDNLIDFKNSIINDPQIYSKKGKQQIFITRSIIEKYYKVIKN